MERSKPRAIISFLNRATSDSLLKWIQSNVGAEFLKQPDFIVTLLSVVLNHVATGGDASKEKERLATFRSLLRSFVTPDDKRMQLTAVYALQVSPGLVTNSITFC